MSTALIKYIPPRKTPAEKAAATRARNAEIKAHVLRFKARLVRDAETLRAAEAMASDPRCDENVRTVAASMVKVIADRNAERARRPHYPGAPPPLPSVLVWKSLRRVKAKRAAS